MECLNIIEAYLNSRVQFMPPNNSLDYKENFLKDLKLYFDEHKVLSKFNLDFVHKQWTINFGDNS